MDIIKTKTGLKIKSRLPGEYFFIPKKESKKFAIKNKLNWEYIKKAPLGKL